MARTTYCIKEHKHVLGGCNCDTLECDLFAQGIGQTQASNDEDNG